MIHIDFSSPVPIYDQIKSALKGLVAKGMLKPGDAAPSIRGLATSLKVNPNTVARAFRELSTEGFLASRRGAGNVISEKAITQVRSGLATVRDNFSEALRLARRSGLDWSGIEELARKVKEDEK